MRLVLVFATLLPVCFVFLRGPRDSALMETMALIWLCIGIALLTLNG